VASEEYYFWPECKYNMTFESYFSNGSALPDFITFDPTDAYGNWYIINTEDILQQGQELEIVVLTSIYDILTPDSWKPTGEHNLLNVTRE
jgi:hypothetical protein